MTAVLNTGSVRLTLNAKFVVLNNVQKIWCTTRHIVGPFPMGAAYIARQEHKLKNRIPMFVLNVTQILTASDIIAGIVLLLKMAYFVENYPMSRYMTCEFYLDSGIQF